MNLFFKKTFILIVCTLLGISVLFGCGKKSPPKTATVITVRVVEAAVADIQVSQQFIGEIKAFNEADVFPRVGGKVKEKIKREGELVKKDEALMVIDRDEVGFEFMPSAVTAPLAGFIANIYVDKGYMVTPEVKVANIISIDNVRIRVNIPEKYLPLMALGKKAEVRVEAYPEEMFTGEISSISPQADTATRTFPVEIVVFNENHKLKPGMFAKIEIVIKQANQAIVIPREAILGLEEENYVFIVEDGVIRKKEVKTGIVKLDKAEIISGISAGVLVVIAGQSRVRDGSKVEIVKEDKK